MAVYEDPAEYPAIHGGDECIAGVRGMQSLSKIFKKPRLLRRGASLKHKGEIWMRGTEHWYWSLKKLYDRVPKDFPPTLKSPTTGGSANLCRGDLER